MSKLFFALAFVISLFTPPWWASLMCAILYLADGGNPLLVVLGGLVFDELFGAPVRSLGGFSYVYTAFAVILSGAALYLRTALFE